MLFLQQPTLSPMQQKLRHETDSLIFLSQILKNLEF